MQLNSLVSNFRETCPQCEQPISVEKGKVTTCLVCNASQVHSDPGPGEIWRRCPVCHIFFQAAPLKSLSCPYCLGNRNLPTNDGFDKWVPDAAFPQVHTNRSQSGTLPESTHNTLVLNGLTAVNKKTAAELAEFNGYALFLDGLINIDKEVAEELAMFRGECLGLYGVGIIDGEVMRILVQWRGKKLSICEEVLTTKAREIMGRSDRSWERVGDVWASF